MRGNSDILYCADYTNAMAERSSTTDRYALCCTGRMSRVYSGYCIAIGPSVLATERVAAVIGRARNGRSDVSGQEGILFKSSRYNDQRDVNL